MSNVLVVKRPVVTYAAAAAPTVFTDISQYVKKITIKPKRGKVDVRGYGDTGPHNEKTDPEHQVDLEFFHSRAWSAFSELMVTELNADDDTTFRVKYRGPTPTGVDNKVFQFAVKFLDLGTIGGEKNTASMMTMTLDIEGVVQASTDGTTFTDYM